MLQIFLSLLQNQLTEVPNKNLSEYFSLLLKGEPEDEEKGEKRAGGSVQGGRGR